MNPFNPPEQPHNHKCQDCGTVWHHDPAAIPESQEALDQAHACPQCGRREYAVNAADSDVPQYCSNGARCILLDGSGKRITPHAPGPYTPEQAKRRDVQRKAMFFADVIGMPRELALMLALEGETPESLGMTRRAA